MIINNDHDLYYRDEQYFISDAIREWREDIENILFESEEI